MGKILAAYKSYRGNENQYKEWVKNKNEIDSKKSILVSQGNFGISDADLLQKKAQTVADSMLVLDNIAQTKAEDVEAVFQTLQIELLAGLGGLTAIPSAIKKLIPVFEKNAEKSSFAKKISASLNKYRSADLKIGKYKLPVPKLITGLMAIVSAGIYVPAVTKSVTNQIGATRRAKFETMQKELSNINDFAVLTPEQELEANKIASQILQNNNKDSNFIRDLKESAQDVLDIFNVPKSLNSVNKLIKDKDAYIQKKKLYDKSLTENEVNFSKTLSVEDINDAKADKQLFENLIANIDLKSQDDLEKIEKIVNVGYGSLFLGGYLEHLLSNVIIKKLKVSNPVAKKLIGFGGPLITYMLCNKELAKIQNGAIKATRFKKLQEYVNDKSNFYVYSDSDMAKTDAGTLNSNSASNNKENIFDFFKRLNKNVKEYRAFQREGLLIDKANLKAKRQIKLTKEQFEDAKLLQRNAFMTISTVDDNNQKYSSAIESISEIALAPIELSATALGAFIGNKVSKTLGNKHSGLITAIGAIVGFLPSAIAEVYTTSQQRKALRISSVVSMDELKDYKQFVNYDNKSFNQQVNHLSTKLPSPFTSFQKHFGGKNS